ncbi:MAG TPA: hypothetical protein VNH22_07750 [Blastocatellia bacterium]|jgi:tetratricopeptide (TPR) repeat protein|nr:hypothetical protein [Blastocatellia bacterium]
MKRTAIRPAYGSYLLSAAVVLTIGSALLQEGLFRAAVSCWSLLLLLMVAAALDRIEFDGCTISRRGPLAFLLSRLARVRQKLSISDVESITTEAMRISFASGDARLSYQTRISGGGVDVVIKSSRAGYIPFIRSLFRAAGPHKLDPRSFELFEYFEAGKAIKGSPVLRNDIALMPVSRLRSLGNSLRLAGRLAQASSYFRIAYEKEPRNPELLYEMARFFHSSARPEDARLLQRSDACLRLAARLASREPQLLERIGEAFVERLDYKRAADCFRRALELDPARFRANIGLAEIALRDGKLAHVALYYGAAAENGDRALARMAKREARYYERLIRDEDFLESELRRIRISNHLRWGQRASALIFLGAWMAAGIAGRFSSMVEDFGLALMATSGLVWFTATMAFRYFRQRTA